MAIVKMNNFSLFAFDSERENLLHELQKFKYVHFLNLDKDETLKDSGLKSVELPESLVAIDEEISRVNYSIDILSGYSIKETGLKAMQKGQINLDFIQLEERAKTIDHIGIYNQLYALWTKREGFHQQVDTLKAKICELEPWTRMNSPIQDLNSLEQSQLFMGTIPKKLKTRVEEELLDTKYTYFEVVSEDKDNIFFIAITSNTESEKLNEILKNNNFSNITLIGEDKPSKEIDRLNLEIKQIENEVADLEQKVRDLSSNLPELEIMYEYLNNKKLRIASAENFLKTDNVDVIQGYVPNDMVDNFKQSLDRVLDNNYYLDIKEADVDDANVPILLKNSKFATSFESLTSMYALPRYNEIDPTPFLAPFYLLFFGMMGADVGYGLIMLIGSMVVLRKFNLKDTTEQFVRFFFYLSFSVILWGLIYGSMFGLDLPMKKLINPAEDYSTLLVISIIFGLIHIYFALGLKAYLNIRDGKVKDAIFDVGFWYMALTGGIVYLLAIVMTIPEAVKNIAFAVMVAGMIGIVATGGRDAKGIGGKIGGGIYSLYGISSYVGDFVSYSRLMALGLSGGFIAGAVNMIAQMLAESGIIGIIFGGIIFIGGQMFNLGLSLLGAYVHSIRLIFVEFFGKFYDGGGKGFNLFRSKAKYINLK